MYLSESLHLNEVADYWRSIIVMNEYQKQRFTKRVIKCLFNNLTGKKIAVLGFAFKKDTSDTRESPAITLVLNFVAEKARVAIYDPKVKEQQIWKELKDKGGDLENMKQNLVICESAYVACADADAVVVVTEWDEFSNKAKRPEPMAAVPPSALHVIDHNRATIPRLLTESEKKPTQTSLHKSGFKPTLEDDLTKPSSPGPLVNVGLDWARVARGMRKPMFVFDGRNILDATKLEALGFRVEAIGRASAVSRDPLD